MTLYHPIVHWHRVVVLAKGATPSNKEYSADTSAKIKGDSALIKVVTEVETVSIYMFQLKN